MKINLKTLLYAAGSALMLLLASPASAVPVEVLWWDSTPEYGGQAPDALRQEMSDYVDNYGDGTVFNSTYVSSEVQGNFSTHMSSNSYDVIVFDSTPPDSSPSFNAADLTAVQSHYSSHSSVLLDGNLYVRSINFNATSDFPGPNGALGGLTINEIWELAEHGGGIMIGTDHSGFQGEANSILGSVIPGAQFTGVTSPSTDGVFYGTDMLDSLVAIAASDVFSHWDSIPSQGIAETGVFTDFLNNSVTLYSQVDVADDPGGGVKNSYISTSWAPGSGTTDVDDDTPGGTGDDGTNNVPEPTTLALMGLGALGFARRRKQS